MPTTDPTPTVATDDTDETPEVRCEECDAITNPDDVHTDRQGHALCGDCAAYCPRCEETVRIDDTSDVTRFVYGTRGRRRDDVRWCDRCVDRHAFHCDECATTFDDAVTSYDVGSVTWCHACVDDRAATCDACGDMFPSDDAHSDSNGEGCYCSDGCTPDDVTDDGVGEYHSTKRRGFSPIVPTMADYGYSRRKSRVMYFGVEHEVERAGIATIADCVRVARDVLGETLAGIDSDSSLDDGIEAITQPCHIGRHRQTWAPHIGRRPFRKVATAHDSGTCGMHIHATRDAVSPLTWAKVLKLMGGADAASAEWWAVVCRRRLSDTSYLASVARKPLADCRETSRNGGHYDVLNFSGEKTVEWRQPRGSTIPETIMGTIEVFHASIRYCQQVGFSEVSVDHFAAWLQATTWIQSDVRLALAYLRRRGLLPTPPPRKRRNQGSTDPAVDNVPNPDTDETRPASTDVVGCSEPTDESHPCNLPTIEPDRFVEWRDGVPWTYVQGRRDRRSRYVSVADAFHVPPLPSLAYGGIAHPYVLGSVLDAVRWAINWDTTEVYVADHGWLNVDGPTLRALPDAVREALAVHAVASMFHYAPCRF
jgi:hypothetical protein